MSTPVTDHNHSDLEDSDPYVRLHSTAEFTDLKRRLYRFVVPATVAFLAWYFLYVILSAYARGFMSTVVVGHINIAFLFGLAQFISTFVIAWAYSRYCAKNFDPQSAHLRRQIVNEE
ncbi:DUF485 domain-containing protein [Haloglycomyces albus]|uniref:DUF485 domain-containing protein n=1 Tax=Haloglycomyces albus TaxID=526067 RepID=UPI00046D86AE|nr:DUF485 domain-containing protein [Haloglycomyces albus]